MQGQLLVRWAVFIVLLACLALGPLMIVAQEEVPLAETPTEVPVATNTETPTVTFTDTLTDIPTLEATPTETLEPTEAMETATETIATDAVPTETAVFEETLESTFTPSPESTSTIDVLPAEPPLALLFSDNFDSGISPSWTLGNGWAVVNGALQVINSLETASVSLDALFNVAVEGRFTLNNGEGRLTVRQNVTGGYTASVSADGQVNLYRANALFQSAIAVPGQTATLRLSAVDDIVRVAVNGIEIIAVRDPAVLPPGGIEISAVFADMSSEVTVANNILSVDDFAVWVPTNELPTPTATLVPPTLTPAVPTQTSDIIEDKQVALAPPPPPQETSVVSEAAPSNNNFANALAAGALIYNNGGSTVDSTLEVGELGSGVNLPSCAYLEFNGVYYDYLVNTVWYTFTPAATGEFKISTPGSSFDTVLAVYVGSSVNALTQIACSDDISSQDRTSRIVVNLNQGQTYRIQVGGFYGSSQGWFGNYKLRIEATSLPPAMVSLNSPANNASVDDTTPLLLWNASAGAATYWVEVDNNLDFSSPEFVSSGVVPTSVTVSPALLSGLYYWRVRAVNLNNQQSAWSVARQFTIGILLTPANQSKLVTNSPSLNPQFSWNPVAGAVGYRLEIDDNPAFSSPEPPIDLPADQTTYNGAPLSQGIYYWRINTNIGSGFVTSPVNWKFTITSPAPGVPQLNSPGNGYATNQASLNLTWQTVNGASAYEIAVDNNSDFSSPEISVAGIVGTAYTANGLQGNQLYYWRVRALNAFQIAGAWSSKRNFTLDSIAPAAPLLTSPTDNRSFTQNRRPTLSWSSVAGVKKYCVQLATNPGFSGFTESCVNSTTFTPASNLDWGFYYWRVFAEDAAQNRSVASLVRAFNVIYLRSPANNAIITSAGDIAPNFRWYAVSGATGYRIQIDDNNGFSSPTQFDLPSAQLNYDALSLSPGVYYWRVNLGPGFSNSPVYWKLTISPAAPGAPTLTSPLNAANTTDSTPTLTWNAVSGAATYQVMVDDNNSFSSPEYLSGSIASLSVTTTALTEAKYYWRVRALNAYQVAGAWSSVRNFTVHTTGPAVPTLTSPADASFITNRRPTFGWSTPASAVSYDIQLATNASFGASSTLYTVGTPSFTPPAPLLQITYFWRVRARDIANYTSAWSAPMQVTINTSTSVAPVLNRYTVSPPTLTWAPLNWASAFEVQVDDQSNFSSPIYSNAAISGSASSVTLSTLPNGTWYWRIRVRSTGNVWTAWSATQTFTIEVP